MQPRLVSRLRHSRLLRTLVSVVISGQVLIGSPVFAEETARFSLYAGGRFSSDVSALAQRASAKTVRKTTRLMADAKRKLAKASVRVNRTVPVVTAPAAELAFGAHVTTETLRNARVFEEPLIPVGDATADENRALGQMLQAAASLPADQQALRIDAYLQNHPASAWKASLLANAATLYAQEGYLSRAASYWQQAFALTRDAIEPGPRAIADYALGEALTQMANFGQLEKIGTLLTDIEGRNVRGSAATKVSYAREALTVLSTHHDLATFSGPAALRRYLGVKPTADPEYSARAIAAYHPPMSGTTLSDLQTLARAAGAPLTMVHLAPIGEIPVPSIVHLRSQHYSAIIGKAGDRYILRDSALGGDALLTGAAIRDESSGYFLISAEQETQLGGRDVPASEAALIVGHCLPGLPADNDPPCPTCGGGGPGPGGMPSYSFHPQKVSLLITDVPLGYTPPVGPAINFHLSYDHRESRHPQTFDSGNVGAMWSHNWLSFVTESPLSVQLRGAGLESHLISTQLLSGAALVTVSTSPVRYERRLPDGTVEVFTAADRPAAQPGRRIFITEVIDPQGHSVELTYDSSMRLVAITDAIGQVTTLDYLDSAAPLRITKITDPFGRFATLTYDSGGRIATITDVAGMSSSFSYGGGDFIQSMTTPYGTTTFRHEPQFADRRIEATDPAGGTERLEYRVSTTALASTVDSADVPTGFSAQNVDMNKYNVLYWDKLAFAAGPTVANATVTSLLLAPTDVGGHAWSRNVPHSVKRPLESRVWYDYANSSGRYLSGPSQAITIARVLEGGASQITQMTYNAQRMITSRIDPVGRQTNYSYASNGLDLLQVEQARSGGTDVLQAYSNYTNHLPGTITDAAGQDTDFTYNSAGQPLTVTNAKNETTTYTYETGTNNLLTVTGAVTGATTSYTYDAYGRVESVEDADGYVVISDYDHLNRQTQRTYPDATTETFTYTKLSLAEQKDRLGRITRHFYDGFGRRIATRDPAGRTVSQVWCDCGAMEALVDANGNRTRWERDVQGRVTREIRADNTTDTLNTYDLSGRQKTVTDPKDQVTTHSYNIDDSLSGNAYTNEVIDTPNVSYTYDAYYARVATMIDGIGTTSYAYKAAGTNGAGQVASVDGPLSNDTIAYTYDELGRVTQRTINGTANQVDWTFDALGRVTSEENLLGEFIYAYDGVTNRLATVTYPNSQTSTYSYLNDDNDHRLQTIHHQYPNASTLSKFDYTYDAAGNILTWRQQADSVAVLWEYGYDQADQLTSALKKSTATPATILQRFAYAYDPAGNRTVEQIDDVVTLSAYDNLNRLTSQAPGGPMVIMGALNEPGTVMISGVPVTVDANNTFRGTVPTTTGTNAFTIVAKDATGNTTTEQYEVDLSGSTKSFTYDANSNLVGDGTRAWEWSATNRVTSVVAGNSRDEFAYNGRHELSRSLSKLDGVTVSDTSRVLCDVGRCEDRPNAGAMTIHTRHGEARDTTKLYFSNDHLGSVREVTDADAVMTARFEYSPWGKRTLASGTSSVRTGFTGHEWNETAGMWFAKYREYDPLAARWLSEDPAGYPDGPNLFSYVRNSPIDTLDPLGLCGCDADCPSGQWRLDSGSFSMGAPGLSFSAGLGRLRCVGKPSMGKWVKVFCSPMGLHWAIGPSLSWQFRGTTTNACNRSEIREFPTKAVIAEGPWLGTDGDSYWTGKGFALGVASAPCRVVPF